MVTIRLREAFLLFIGVFAVFALASFEIIHAEYMTVKVKVVDDNGTPLPHATVLMFQGGCYVASNNTNDYGITIFSYVDPRFDVRFLIYYKGIKVGDFSFNRPLDYVILKCKVYWVKVKVLDHYGDPIPNAEVTFSWTTYGETYFESNITDANGMTEIRAPCTAVSIIIKRPYDSSTVELLRDSKVITSRETLTYNVDLYRLKVLVVDRRGFIVKGASVYLKSLNYSFIVASNLEDEYASFSLLPSGQYEVLALYGSHSNTTIVSLPKDTSAVVRLSNLAYGIHSLTILVSWANGEPVVNANVTLFKDGLLIDQGVTDEHGITFFLLNEGEYRVEIDHPDAENKHTFMVYVSEDIERQVMLVYKWHYYDLLVTVRSGDMLVPNALVTVYEDGDVIAEAYTDDNGVASLTLREGNYTVSVYHENFGSKSIDVSLNRDLSVEVVLPETLVSILYGLMPYFIVIGVIVVAVIGVVMYVRYKRSELL